jgi:hypothetical protein
LRKRLDELEQKSEKYEEAKDEASTYKNKYEAMYWQ